MMIFAFLVYNLALVSIAAWWLSDLKKSNHLQSVEAICSIIAIALHASIIFKLIAPTTIIPDFINLLTALPLNALLIAYWGGVVLYHFVGIRKAYYQRVKIRQFGR
jgi:hypothetical protein